MATTYSGNLQADVRAYLAEEVLPIAQKILVIHQFGQKYRLPRGHGTAMTFTRYNRLPLPFGPLAEGVPAPSQALTIQQVNGVAQQWGGQVVLTDVGELTIFHNPFQQAKRLVALQVAETMDRNDFLALMGGTQVNYINTKGSRGALVAGDVLDPYTVQRTYAALDDIHAPQFNGEPASQELIRRDIRQGQPRAGANPRSTPHYVAVTRTFPIQDLRANPLVTNAWAFSDVNKLYNAEIGEWNGIRWCSSNMVPSWFGVAAVTASSSGSGGTFASGTYSVQVTGVDTQNQYESRVYAVQTGLSVTSPAVVTLTTPNIAGFTFNVYVDTNSSPQHLGLSTSGPTTGALAGQAVQLPANTAVTITGVGLPMTPPAAPAPGVTVYPVFIFGEDAFGIVELQDVEYSYLNSAEKFDPQNQLRVVAWKVMNGAMVLNGQFMARIECASAFSPTFG